MTVRSSVAFGLFVSLCVFGGSMTEAQIPSKLDSVDEADFGELAELMRFLRSEKKESLFVPVAKLQLSYLDDAASSMEATDPDRAVEIRRFARGVAFNIASFTWPGWGDSPEPISQARQELGFQAAKRAVELAERIGDVTPNALWILGAHQLNAGQYDDAISSFERAKGLARNDFYRSMHEAWQTLTRVLAADDHAGLKELNTAIDELRSLDAEDAAFFADQLTTARRVYTENAEP